MRYTFDTAPGKNLASSQSNAEKEGAELADVVDQFHDLIGHIGQGVAGGQHAADMTRLRQEVSSLRAERNGEVPKGFLPEVASFQIPRVDIALNLDVSSSHSGKQRITALEGAQIVPRLPRLSVKNTKKEDLYLSSNITMAMVAVPPPEIPLGNEQTQAAPQLTAEQAIATASTALVALVPALDNPDARHFQAFYRQEVMRWCVELRKGETVSAMASVSDTRNQLEFARLYQASPSAQLPQRKRPLITSISPSTATFGEEVVLAGKNLGSNTLTEVFLYPYAPGRSLSTIRKNQDSLTPIRITPSMAMPNAIHLVVDEHLISGWLQVRCKTADGNWMASRMYNKNRLIIEPSNIIVHPLHGYHHPSQGKGTPLTVKANNLFSNTMLEFSPGIRVKPLEHTPEPAQIAMASYEVPPGAQSGAVKLISAFRTEVRIQRAANFFLRPVIISIKVGDSAGNLTEVRGDLVQAPAGKSLVLEGFNLNQVLGIQFALIGFRLGHQNEEQAGEWGGLEVLESTHQTAEPPLERLTIPLPTGAGDGKIQLLTHQNISLSTPFFFFQAPNIRGLYTVPATEHPRDTAQAVLETAAEKNLYLVGSGFGKSHVNLIVHFETLSGGVIKVRPSGLKTERTVQGLQPGEAEIEVVVPAQGVSGLLHVIRTEVSNLPAVAPHRFTLQSSPAP